MAKIKARILVIDDEIGIRELLSYELGNLGYEVDTASTGEEGISKITHKKYDIAISDIKMPKMDGLQTLAAIKKGSPETEVIMVTGFATVENAVCSLKQGAYDFIQKPFNFDELSIIIEKALEKSELRTLVALYESSKAVFASKKLEELFPVMISLVKKVVQGDEVALLLLDHQDQLYLAAASFPLVYYPTKGTLISLAERLLAAGKTQSASLIDGTPASENPLYAGIMQNSQLKAVIAYPLVLRDKNLGMLMITRSKDHSDFSSSDIRNLSIFVSQITQSIANTKLYEKLEIKSSEFEACRKTLARLNKHIEFLENISAQTPEPALTDIDMNSLISELLDAMEYSFDGIRIRLEKDTAAGLPKIKADPQKIKEMLFHILLNARKAYDKPIENPDDESIVSVKASSTGETLVITVTDNGSGLARENSAERLALAANIAKKYSGSVTAQSTPKKGTAVTVTFTPA